MKKFRTIFLTISFVICIGSVIFLIINKNVASTDIPNTNNEQQELSLTVSSEMHMVVGESKVIDFYCNSCNANISIQVENRSILYVDENKTAYALMAGNTNCDVTASFLGEVVTQRIIISVVDKNIEFVASQSVYYSGPKADGTYPLYGLKIMANYNMQESELILNEEIVVVNSVFSNDYNTVDLFFTLTSGGNLKISLDGFSYNFLATDYINSLELEFLPNDIFENDTLYLFCLSENKNDAYNDGFYDYANVTFPNNFEVEIANQNVVTFVQNKFEAQGEGTTTIIFKANDGSGYQKSVNVIVNEIEATSCDVLPSENVLYVNNGEIFEIETQNFLPTYAGKKNILIEVGENLILTGNDIACNGNGEFNIYLNGILIKTISVIIEEPNIPPKNYTPLITSQIQEIVDNENHSLTFEQSSTVAFEFRLYLTDDENNLVSPTITIVSGESTAILDGNILLITPVNNSVLRIWYEDYSCDYNIIVG